MTFAVGGISRCSRAFSREKCGQGDAVRHDLGGAVQLVQADELSLGPFGGEDLHVHATKYEVHRDVAAACSPTASAGGRGHHDRRAEGNRRHDRVLGGVGMREHGVEHHGARPADGPECPGESRQVGVAAYAVQTDDRGAAHLEFRQELVGHDAEHHRIEPLPVEFVEKAEQMTFDATERVPLDEVDDSDRVLHPPTSLWPLSPADHHLGLGLIRHLEPDPDRIPQDRDWLSVSLRAVRPSLMSRSRTVVGEGGLEPPHPFGHRNLNPARLPIPPLARVTGQQ